MMLLGGKLLVDFVGVAMSAERMCLSMARAVDTLSDFSPLPYC